MLQSHHVRNINIQMFQPHFTDRCTSQPRRHRRRVRNNKKKSHKHRILSIKSTNYTQTQPFTAIYPPTSLLSSRYAETRLLKYQYRTAFIEDRMWFDFQENCENSSFIFLILIKLQFLIQKYKPNFLITKLKYNFINIIQKLKVLHEIL